MRNPAVGQSWASSFRKEADLVKTLVEKDLSSVRRGAWAVLLTVRHAPYLDLPD